MKTVKNLYLVAIMGAVVLGLLAGGVVYFYKEAHKNTIDKVAKLMVLPQEPATEATVWDKNKLGDLSFFKSAQNGDKVLMFVKAEKVILYRPSINKIIDVGNINTTVIKNEN